MTIIYSILYACIYFNFHPLVVDRKLFFIINRRRRRYYYYYFAYTDYILLCAQTYNSTRDPVLIIIRITFNWTASPLGPVRHDGKIGLYVYYFFFHPVFISCPDSRFSTNSIRTRFMCVVTRSHNNLLYNLYFYSVYIYSALYHILIRIPSLPLPQHVQYRDNIIIKM